MQEEVVSEGEISLSDIFRALWAKIWIILASLLVGVIVGGTLGFVKNHDVHYYGASVDLFLSPPIRRTILRDKSIRPITTKRCSSPSPPCSRPNCSARNS